MKKIALTYILFLCLPNMVLAKNQDTIPHKVDLHVLELGTNTPINNVYLTAYKWNDANSVGADDDGKTEMIFMEGRYIIRVSELEDSGESMLKEYGTTYHKFTVEEGVKKTFDLFIKPKINQYTTVLYIRDEENKKGLDSVSVEINGIDGKKLIYTNDNGEITVVHEDRCLSLNISHDNYATKETFWCTKEDTQRDTHTIELTNNSFTKNIKIQDEKENPIAGVTINFPDLNVKQITDDDGIATFDFLPYGYQKIEIGFKEGYKKRENEDYVFVSEDSRDFESAMTLGFEDPPKKILIKGTLLEDNKPISGAEIFLRHTDNSVVNIGITDNDGLFSKELLLETFGSKYQFDLKISHYDFEDFTTETPEFISLYEFENNLKEINVSNYKFIRKNAYYTIKLKMKKSEITDKLSVEFRNSNNDSIKQEIEASQITGKDGYVVVNDIRGLHEFNQVFVKTTINNEDRCKTIKVKNRQNLESKTWKLKKCK